MRGTSLQVYLCSPFLDGFDGLLRLRRAGDDLDNSDDLDGRDGHGKLTALFLRPGHGELREGGCALPVPDAAAVGDFDDGAGGRVLLGGELSVEDSGF